MTNLCNQVVVILAFVLYASATTVAQGSIGTTLAQAISENSVQDHRVVVYLKPRADIELLDEELKTQKIPVKERPLLVKTALQNVAFSSQDQLVNDLLQLNSSMDFQSLELKRLWINNCLVMWANEPMIEFMAQHQLVELVDLNDARRIRTLDPPKRSGLNYARTPGAAEPGLLTIGADQMWNMGYTGKNRVSYSIDTGVWPDHPAIDDQFLGNYYPLDLAWYAYDSELPSDKSGAHGTHTIGTALGLDEDNNDTIGVAFNAYYIASDPVATSLATVKPLTDFMFAFEWAFDPDGNPATTSDIPDVINNSWGYDVPSDDVLCESYASEMFTAIQVAGIANVMSAGNDGPGPMTIGIPHHISTGLVNTFSVGAVNGHDPALSIAGFSSRGPTICPATGSLQIKPEVVAPGVAVRSAIENGEYDSYQGTSMAGPHVTGAVLLLREAFPNVSGEEILLALYHSAMDLGEVGEDNTYGNGMINVLAAFNLLAQTNAPVPPDSTTLDIAVSDIIIPDSELHCGATMIPQVVLTNLGMEVITEVDIIYSIVGETDHTFNWVGTLDAGQSITVTLDPINITTIGFAELWIRSVIPGGANEADPVNNNRVKRIDIRPVAVFPFYENFENGSIHNGKWMVRNKDASITWDTVITGGLDWSQYSVQVDMSNYNPRARQKDELISPLIPLPIGDAATLKFDLSYSFEHEFFADSLEVLLSTDCGDSWSRIYLKGGEDLGLPDSITNGSENFVPTQSDHWRTETIELTGYAGQEVIINFTSTNMQGSHLVLDNVRVFVSNDPAGIKTLSNPKISIYPNPASTAIYLRSDLSITATLFVSDLTGRTVKKVAKSKYWADPSLVDVSDLLPGTYMVSIQNEDLKVVRPLVIAR